MPNNLLFAEGGAAVGAYQMSYANVDDNGTPVLIRAQTAVFAPNGWWQEALHRILTLMVSTNVGCALQVTPEVEGLLLDGTGGRPDARVAFVIPVPSAGGERATIKVNVGLYQPVDFLGTPVGRTGLRGTFVRFLLESTSALVIPAGMESPPDCRFDGTELEWEPLLGRQQVTNA